VLSIIIPTYNRNSVLQSTLAHLEESIKNIKCEVIVVNDSKDTTITNESKIRNIKLTQNPSRGASSARNYGFKISAGSIILFLDDDMLISEEVLLKLIKLTKTGTKKIFLPNWTYPVSLVSDLSKSKFGRFLTKIKYTSLQGWIGSTDNWQSEEVENGGIASYCLMLTRENFIEIGGYNENFSFAGFEDHDLSSRLTETGFKFYILTKLFIYHNEWDRTDLASWVRRRRRNALTQREAVEIGYENLRIRNKLDFFPYPRLLMIISTFLHSICTIIPNFRILDILYLHTVKALVAINIYLGYNYDKRK
jgi:GT2 family glycosyltransferase